MHVFSPFLRKEPTLPVLSNIHSSSRWPHVSKGSDPNYREIPVDLMSPWQDLVTATTPATSRCQPDRSKGFTGGKAPSPSPPPPPPLPLPLSFSLWTGTKKHNPVQPWGEPTCQIETKRQEHGESGPWWHSWASPTDPESTLSLDFK